jgi:hypothetical protein
MNNSIPVFFDPKNSDKCIYYVGHWVPVPFTAKELPTSSSNEFSMCVSLQFSSFDVALAKEMVLCGSGMEDEKERNMVKKEGGEIKENLTCLTQSTGYHMKSSATKRLRTAGSFAFSPTSLGETYTCPTSLTTLKESAIRRSCGRTRETLNMMNLGHRHGMFASFSNQEFW